jgi:hypothetical protein
MRKRTMTLIFMAALAAGTLASAIGSVSVLASTMVIDDSVPSPVGGGGSGSGSGSGSTASTCKASDIDNLSGCVGDPSQAQVDTGSKGMDVGTVVGEAISYVMWVVGIVSVVMIIIGGIQYATASGDESKTTKARKIIIGAIVGLSLAVLAYTITWFIKTLASG